MNRKPLLAAFLAAIVCSAGPALHAQSAQPVTATISALSLQPVPEGATVEVVTYDDSDLAQSIGNAARQGLRDSGRELADDGARLQLGIELIDQLSLSDREPTLGSARVESGPTDESNVRVNIFADSEDSVLGGRIDPGAADAVRFGLYVTLNDRTTGRRLWQAEILANIGNSRRETVGPLMAQAIVERIGEPASLEEFVLE